MLLQILLAITFVFGVVRLISFTKIFDKDLVGIIKTIIPINRILYEYLDYLIFYGSLCFQAWYWLFQS